MIAEFCPPNKSKNSFITLHDNNELVNIYGSFAIFDNSQVISCCEDAYMGQYGEILYSGKSKWENVVQSFNRFIKNFDLNKAYILPCEDIIIFSSNLKLLIFADKVSFYQSIEMLKSFKQISLESVNDKFFMFCITGETIIDIFVSEYDFFCPTVLLFNNDKMLNIYCFWKLVNDKNEILLTSYELRNKNNKSSIKKFQNIIGSKIKNIHYFDNFIYILEIDNNYKLYIYVENRFYSMPQIKIIDKFSVTILKYQKNKLINSKHSIK